MIENEFEFLIASVPDREKVVAEIWHMDREALIEINLKRISFWLLLPKLGIISIFTSLYGRYTPGDYG